MPPDDLLRWSSNGVRVRTWQAQQQTAHLTPMRQPGALRRNDVDEIIDALVVADVTGAVTSAIGPFEEQIFLDAGFVVHERLLLLRHSLDDVDEPPTTSMRRASRRDHDMVLHVDGLAFQDFWKLDDAGLSDAISATPHSRFRVSEEGEITGYAITGRAGSAGFLQRLAVHPGHQGRSIGRALVLDGLHWLKRRHATHALVNTQMQNTRATELYERVGFRREPHDLTVLRWGEVQ